MRLALHSATALLLTGTFASAAVPASGRSPLQVVRDFTAARVSFDQRAVRELTKPGYVEISPLGEMDEREAVIGFYSPDKRTPAPSAVLEDAVTRSLGDGAALVTVRIIYTMPTNGREVDLVRRAMRGSFVVERDPSGWKLLFAQYTGVRPSNAGVGAQPRH